MLNNQIRRILARYYEDPQDSLHPSAWNVPFLEYLKKKNPDTGNKDTLGTPGETEPGVSYNPYIIPDPSTAPKDIGDSEVFVKDIPTHPVYNKGIVFEKDSPLYHWQKSRRRDWTDDPKEQQPAISITRRHASAKSALANYLLDSYPLILSQEDYNNLGSRVKTAVSLNQVLNKDYHYKNDKKIQRAERVSVRWKNEGDTDETKKGKFIWVVKSADSDNTHTVIFQFMQAPEAKGVTKYIDLPVKMACSCESFLWYGAQWYAIQDTYMYLPAIRRSVMPPRPHTQISRVRPGKGLNFRVCKHILAVYDEIENWDLKTEYKHLIKVSPLSKIMNPKEFERLLGIPFTYKDIKEQLQKFRPMTPKIRNFFRYKVEGTKLQKKALSKLDRWYFTKFRKMTDPAKLKALEAYVNHPEEIFYLMLRDAIVKNGKISDDFIKEGVILMSKVIDPEYGFKLKRGELDEEPEENEIKQEGLSGVSKEEKKVGDGMGLASPEDVKRNK